MHKCTIFDRKLADYWRVFQEFFSRGASGGAPIFSRYLAGHGRLSICCYLAMAGIAACWHPFYFDVQLLTGVGLTR